MDYTLIRAKKRTLSLQVSGTGEVIARAPLYMPKFLIDQFVKSKATWITKRQQELMAIQPKTHAYFTVEHLKTFIEQAVKEYSQILGLHPTGLRFTQVSSYWGTCAPSGRLSFNLALRYTAPAVVTYVVVHELSHLKYRGHGKRFWDFVVKNYPYTIEAKRILRKIPRGTI